MKSTRMSVVAACLVVMAASANAADPTAGLATIPGPGVPPGTFAMPPNPPETWLTYHLAHPGPGGTYPADPNCAIYYKGKYHMHYIYNLAKWCDSYAHVVSTDMVHWTWAPTPLTKAGTGHRMFSGAAFFTKEGRPAVIYHGEGSRRNQIAICLDDNLEKFTKPYPLEAKTKDGAPSKIVFWDPDAWLDGQTYYSISGGKAMLLKSTDLKTWEDMGPLLHDAMPANLGVGKGEDISCPNMFKIGNKWMLLCISHGMGCRYYLGTFKDGKYLPDFHARMNWRKHDVFAPESLLTPDGRRVMWAWCEFGAKGLQGGIQTLPRELSLPADGVLRINPLKELESLRTDPKPSPKVTVKDGTTPVAKGIEGDALELAVRLVPKTAKACGLRVLCDANGAGGMAIKYDPAAKCLMLDSLKVPFQLKPAEKLELRVFVDKIMVEVFANTREAALALCPAPAGKGVSFFSEGGDTEAQVVGSWKMKSAYGKDTPKP